MSRMPRAGAPQTQRLAAIDLGSNSFHLLIADHACTEERLRVVARRGEKVQLGAGLDADGNLDEQAMQRALDCLDRFAPLLEDIPACNIRVVATNALRNARNGHLFIERALALLGHEIEIIAGREEARLIHLGVTRDLPDLQERHLVVDIGGGSTEFVIGEAGRALALESLATGCVSWTRDFFGNGDISEERFRQAELAALSELASIRRGYMARGWRIALGASGTIKAVAAVLAAGSRTTGTIRRGELHALRARVIARGSLDRISLEGLKRDRARIFPAGVAILGAIFEAFELDAMRYTPGALREGVLFDLVDRRSARDPRPETLATLARRAAVDRLQADNVAASAGQAFDQVREAWQLDDAQRQLLLWAAQLHEVGKIVSHSKFHRHGAYLLEHADLAGFSRPEQQALAFLVQAHRRRFPLAALKSRPLPVQRYHACLARLLRLAVLLNRSRPRYPVEDFHLSCEGDTLRLALGKTLARCPILLSDLDQECRYQQAAGFTLQITHARDVDQVVQPQP